MPRVCFSDQLQRYTDGVREVNATAADYRALVGELDARFPGIGEVLRDRVSVAIDGEISHDPYLEPIPPDAEVHFLPKLAAG